MTNCFTNVCYLVLRHFDENYFDERQNAEGTLTNVLHSEMLLCRMTLYRIVIIDECLIDE